MISISFKLVSGLFPAHSRWCKTIQEESQKKQHPTCKSIKEQIDIFTSQQDYNTRSTQVRQSWLNPVFCILTSKRVVCTLLASRNYLFGHFNIFFHQKLEKPGKNHKKRKTLEKGVCQDLDATPKCWLTTKRWSTPGENIHCYYSMKYCRNWWHVYISVYHCFTITSTSL